MTRLATYRVDIARIAREQGVAARHVQCIAPRYTGPQRRVCTRANLPPLLSRDAPALLAPTARGAVPQAEWSNAPTWETPWGETVRGLRVPIAAYGVLRGYCRVQVEEGAVLLLCPGEPWRRLVKALRRAAEKLGARVEVATVRVYTWHDVPELAETLPRLKRILLTPVGVPHLIIAAYRYAVERLRYSIDELPVIVTAYDPSLSSRERNLVKNATDWMCAQGDQVACYASPWLHRAMWLELLERGVIRHRENL